VGKVNVHENFELAGKYRINTIPRVFIFNKSDKPLYQKVGLVPEQDLVKLLNEVLQPK
jgi:thioredoxin-like negative regulator of GroEL